VATPPITGPTSSRWAPWCTRCSPASARSPARAAPTC
jgi:hypothetical protein